MIEILDVEEIVFLLLLLFLLLLKLCVLFLFLDSFENQVNYVLLRNRLIPFGPKLLCRAILSCDKASLGFVLFLT